MLITLEGIEGAGKSSQVEAAARFVRAAGRACITTREPGATDLGQRIRRILLDPACAGMDPRAELLLYLADRVEHVQRVIRPALARGQVVICDRYVDATLAYQGAARGVDADLIERLHALVLGDWRPGLTVLIDIPVAVGLDRAWRAVDRGERSPAETRFEKENRDFHQRVRQGYLELAAREPARFCIIDGNRAPGEVARDLQAAIADRLHLPLPDRGGNG
ncbi:MAG TPA: dTMP kinase [Desulfobacteraceae bacterium]|nr:dTMP kinase [Deltaproteobacteria bacterium]RLB98053.1 MAG: dTMP kinase [Deltaproteobacteria bacterium]HDI60995.1 dTMP kinase [Desulfobacteraceae bacterium]